MRYWAVLSGFRSFMHKLPDGSIPGFHRCDELQQLFHRHLSGIHRFHFVRKLHGMYGGELLRHNWSHGRHCCVHAWSIFVRFVHSVH